MKKVIAFVFALMAVSVKSGAQQAIASTLKQLNEVTITTNRIYNFNTGNKIEEMDSMIMIAYKHQSLADLLSSQNQLFVKSYGPGSLASTSFRGAGAEQTAILWNGFNLQSPMNGQIDFSLMQTDVIDNIKIQYGSSGALFGSGAVGGVIHLQNKPDFGSGFHLELGLQAGSFENYKENFRMSYGGRNFYSSFRIFNQNSTNDFPFINTFLAGTPVVNQTNAGFIQQGVMSNNYFLISKDQQINFRVWYQNSQRQIPPPMSVSLSDAKQQDETLRISGEWSLQKNDASYFIRSAWFDEKLVYTDSSSSLISNNQAQTNITEAESKIILNKNQILNIGLNNTFSIAEIDSHLGIVSQNRTSIFASYKIYNSLKNFQTCLSVREEFVLNNLIPIIPSVGMEWNINKQIRIFGNASRSYRLPTLNERFWNPGGNLNLKPEQGWAEEISFNIKQNISLIKIDLTATIFNRIINDWIQWIPTGSYWSPQNIMQVWSRGAEGNFKMCFALHKWNFIYSLRMNYVLSTNERSDVPNDITLHKQLIYVPRLNYTNQLTATYKLFFINISQTYTGIRFTQSDESDWLMYYLLYNISAGKEFAFNHFAFILNAQLNNIFNENYQVIENRPMPGRNFLIGITFKI